MSERLKKRVCSHLLAILTTYMENRLKPSLHIVATIAENADALSG